MYVHEFFDKKPHTIKLKSWKDNYISLQLDNNGNLKITRWDNDKFEWTDYTFTLSDLTDKSWEETEI